MGGGRLDLNGEKKREIEREIALFWKLAAALRTVQPPVCTRAVLSDVSTQSKSGCCSQLQPNGGWLEGRGVFVDGVAVSTTVLSCEGGQEVAS